LELKYRRLGRSDIKVSEIGFGAWTIGLNWWGKKIEDDEAIRMLKRAYDLGINFYDTGDIYGKGKSEKLIGVAFKDMRNEIVYSTKWGYDMYNAEQIGHNELPQKHNVEYLQYALSQSLERLQTDYIDVYNLHNPKMQAVTDKKLFNALDTLVTNGKIKSHGIALGPAIGWKEEGLHAISEHDITCLQTVFNILEQDPGNDLLKAGKEKNVGIMARVPDASGILTGKVNENTTFSKNDHRSVRKKEWISEALKKVENMKTISDKKGWDITDLAIKFILSHEQISVVLPTMISVEEIDRFSQISDGNYLNLQEMNQISEMYHNNFYVATSETS
jgi:aryl-alcohol dehydrogenase-like predicted oxidoreductase